ncbi:T9SS type A sorting domain-containing protein [Pedobacter sp. ASV28]|uniref:T9SS type A sorting domain-containing protein n=1 Tax=Pedobacter sp. ASV28 TaxID=2795123 RepID=UPI0018EAD3A5|nr:T9SS type A sorting domain-containing protein [Pedobacter sp. ASV28]
MSELASDIYELERNTDGRNFVKIASIKANGKASNYNYTDESPGFGGNYYRLKLIEENGNAQYSQIVNANVKSLTDFSVAAYPNPVVETLYGNINGKTEKNATVTLLDINQKTIKKIAVTDSKFSINMKNMAVGVYLLKYSDQFNTYIQKIIKK